MFFVLLFNNLARLCLCLSLLTVTSYAFADGDYEQQLDQYVNLTQTDNEAAEALLQKLYESVSSDTPIFSKVRMLSYLATDALRAGNDQLADYHLAKLLALAEQTNNNDTLAEIYTTELAIHLGRQQITDAILKADRVDYFSQLTTSARIRFVSFSTLGRLYLADKQYEQALKQYTKALDAIMETNDERTLLRRASLQYQITQVHMSLKNWAQAKELIEALIQDANRYQQRQFLPDLYLWLGVIEAELQQYDRAIAFNEQGLALALEFNDESLSLTFKNNLGSIYIEIENYVAAQDILEQALGQARAADDEYNWQFINFNLGYIQVMLGNVDAGLAQMHEGLAFEQAQGYTSDYESLLEWLAKAYGAAGMYQLQAETLLEQITLRKDIFNAERDKVMAELNSRFDTKAKTQQITILQQENDLKAQLLANQTLQKRITALFSLVLAFAGVMLFQLYRKVRMSNKRLREANKQLEFQSLRDPLTGLLNRRALQEHMQKRQDLARRHGDASPTGLLILDIDFFKNINDQYGHAAGDAVLIEISKRLNQQCRQEDLVIRWGGEEFLIVLAQPEPQHINALCQRILTAIAQTPVTVDGQQIVVTISGGYIQLPFAAVAESTLNWERALQIADMALYLSKVSGRNQVHALIGLKTDYASTEALLHSDLSGAIRQNMVDYNIIKGPQTSDNHSK